MEQYTGNEIAEMIAIAVKSRLNAKTEIVEAKHSNKRLVIYFYFTAHGNPKKFGYRFEIFDGIVSPPIKPPVGMVRHYAFYHFGNMEEILCTHGDSLSSEQRWLLLHSWRKFYDSVHEIIDNQVAYINAQLSYLWLAR